MGSSRRASERQRALFEALSRAGRLVFATGPDGISANLVGRFEVRALDREDLLCCDDGTHHVHVDWRRVKRVEAGEHHGEGMLTFFDGEERLFRLYCLAGPWPEDVPMRTGDLR